MVKLNARCSAILQNELPPKEKDPGSFILPRVIGTTTVSNALADLGASISIMPFSLFKRLGLGNPKPINMVIEMADRSMQSPKGIVENVLVKINKFIFPVDFIILDIIEDDKVPIILGRPMLATAHARIDVFGGWKWRTIGKWGFHRWLIRSGDVEDESRSGAVVDGVKSVSEVGARQVVDETLKRSENTVGITGGRMKA
ncbi:retrovirus-related pol polyprotein from transposon TNT 1-94 [Tanacetum coccineum]